MRLVHDDLANLNEDHNIFPMIFGVYTNMDHIHDHSE